MSTAFEPREFLVNASQYYQMAELGLFEGKRVELIEGRIIEMSPAGSKHATAVMLAQDASQRAFGKHYYVRAQCPLDLGQASVPQPDIAVVKGHVRDFTKAHPTSALLVIEVADTTLKYDRRQKASLYARAGIQEYWIINLIGKRVEIYRKPVENPAFPFGFYYAESKILTGFDSIKPLAAKSEIAVADLLP
ncbi:MAG: Uma2 family endonuclease [Acidobacteria bacterium]|nr:Uma2 family endonuclease [Acidobacteriota bacterium]